MSKYLADYGDTTDFVDGEGCFLIDRNGKRYIDFLGGWCVSTVGWKHPKMMEVLQDTKNRGFYIPPSYSWPEWESFAKLLADITPGKLQKVFRTTSGSEAVEMAIKIARAATGRKKIVSIDEEYHGHTYGALSVGSALTSAIAPGVPEMLKLPLPNVGNAEDVIAQFEKIASAGDLAAFLGEPVFTNSGTFVPPADFYPRIAEICKQNGTLFVMDEVATGFGRTGKLFASEHWNLEPDIMCLAKGFSGGYATIGATIVTEEVANRVFEKGGYFPYYSTFGWMPDDMIITRKNVELVCELKLWENAESVGKYLLTLLKPLEDLAKVKEVRGIGMLFAIELKDKSLTGKISSEVLKNGLVVDTASPEILFFSPPLIMDKETATKGARILSEVIKKHCS